jgi:hypothetical protein
MLASLQSDRDLEFEITIWASSEIAASNWNSVPARLRELRGGFPLRRDNVIASYEGTGAAGEAIKQALRGLGD